MIHRYSPIPKLYFGIHPDQVGVKKIQAASIWRKHIEGKQPHQVAAYLSTTQGDPEANEVVCQLLMKQLRQFPYRNPQGDVEWGRPELELIWKEFEQAYPGDEMIPVGLFSEYIAAGNRVGGV